jgi:hypothetical protein
MVLIEEIEPEPEPAISAAEPSTADIMACPSMFTGCCAHQPLDNRAKVT